MSAPAREAHAGLEIAPYDDALAPAHARFAERMWPTKRRRREPRFNRWKFRGPESGPVPGFLLAHRDGEVVGQLGLIPAVLAVDEQRVPCQWFCDIMVDPAARGQGVAARMYAVAMSRGMVSLGSNASRAADITMQRVGFTQHAGPAITVLALDASHAVSWKLPAQLRSLAPAIGRALQPVLDFRTRALVESRRPAADRAAHVEWQEVVSRVRAHQSRSRAPHILHDEIFLHWRCSGLPGFVEPLSALISGNDAYAIVGRGGDYFYVFDWGADSQEDFDRLFSAARTMALEAGARTMQAYANGARALEWLRSAGFLVMRTPCQILCHPATAFPADRTRMDYSIFDSDGNL